MWSRVKLIGMVFLINNFLIPDYFYMYTSILPISEVALHYDLKVLEEHPGEECGLGSNMNHGLNLVLPFPKLYSPGDGSTTIFEYLGRMSLTFALPFLGQNCLFCQEFQSTMWILEYITWIHWKKTYWGFFAWDSISLSDNPGRIIIFIILYYIPMLFFSSFTQVCFHVHWQGFSICSWSFYAPFMRLVLRHFIVWFATRSSFISFFPTCVFLFIFLSILAGPPTQCWITVVTVYIFALFLKCKEKESISLFNRRLNLDIW